MGLGIRTAVRKLLQGMSGKADTPPAKPQRIQEWSISLYSGDSPLSLSSAPSIRNPILRREDVTDVPARFVADPFMLREGDVWYLFFEVLNAANNRGEIGLATSRDGVNWTYDRIVLAEKYHLSYPFVFRADGVIYMMPEGWRGHGVTLYAAERFPYDWKPVKRILDGGRFADASLVHADGHWWMFVDDSPEIPMPRLSLYHATNILGEWTRHPMSPLVVGNPKTARPCGRPVFHNGRIIRFTQEVSPVYGRCVRAFEISHLTETEYEEQCCGTDPLYPGGDADWNRDGMHHVDAHEIAAGEWLACVDGFRWQPAAPSA